MATMRGMSIKRSVGLVGDSIQMSLERRGSEGPIETQVEVAYLGIITEGGIDLSLIGILKVKKCGF